MSAQQDLLCDMAKSAKKYDAYVFTTWVAHTPESLYPEGHRKRVEQDSWNVDSNVFCSSRNNKEKKPEHVEPAYDSSREPHIVNEAQENPNSGDEQEPPQQDDNNDDVIESDKKMKEKYNLL